LLPTAEPTSLPTAEPTSLPTAEPTSLPTGEPTSLPTGEPTALPTEAPIALETADPTVQPTVLCEEEDIQSFEDAILTFGSAKLRKTCLGGFTSEILSTAGCKCLFALHEPENIALVDENLPTCTMDIGMPTDGGSERVPKTVQEMLMFSLVACIETGGFTTAAPPTEPAEKDFDMKHVMKNMVLKGTNYLVKGELPENGLKQLNKDAKKAVKQLKKFSKRVGQGN